MLLKRNLLTILYSLLFVAFFGLGLMELVYLSVTNAENRNIIACIIILGIIIYLIAAFFVKESGSFQFVQKNTPILTVIEVLFTVIVCGGLFYMTMDKGIDNSALIALMLVSIYLSGRLLGGRLCGFMALLIGFFYILTMSNMEFDAEQYINTLCFLLPYALFLFITRVLTKSFVESGFIIFVSYLALSVIFALFIVLNPLTCILLFGCVFSLAFAKPEKKGSIVAAGPFSACILVVFTVLLLVGIRLYMQELFILPELEIDIFFLQSSSYIDIAEYVLEKYTKAVNLLYQPFQLGIFPSILMFLGCASGYYAIRKKASGIGPLCLTYLLVLTYYLLYSESGSHFYYMTYFLPVFAAYGFYNTLLSDTPVRIEKKKTNTVPAGGEEETGKAEPKKEETVETEPEKVEIVNSQPEKVEKKEDNSAEKKPVQDKLKEKMLEEKLVEAKEDVKAKPVKIKEKKAMMKSNEIPEWHAPEEFSAGYRKTEEPGPAVKAESETVVGEDTLNEEVTDGALETDDLKTDDLKADDIQTEYVQDSTADSIADEELIGKEIANESLIDEGIVSKGLSDEEVEDAGVLENSNLETNDLEVDNLETDIAPEEDSDSLRFEDEETKLNSFLDRLDISENIRRMNESAQEDMADIIEREDSQEELLSAIPMEDLDVIEGSDGKLYADTLDSAIEPEEVSESQSSVLPKYEKPDFDYNIEPATQSLQETYTNISEYDDVPTIHGLEKEWKNTEQTEKSSGFAYSLDDVKDTEEAATETSTEGYSIHSEEIIRKSGIGKRSYHKITIE